MRVLVDTHVLIWAELDNGRISSRAQELLESTESEIFVSAASAWELVTKVRLGKLPGAEALVATFPQRIEALGFHKLSVTIEHAQRAGLLDGDHKDPFDRLLVAQALIEEMIILSNDQALDRWHVSRLW